MIDELYSTYIELDPRRPTVDNARLRISGVPIWALIEYYLYAVNEQTECVVRDFEILPAEMTAALAFYQKYAHDIDLRIARNQLPTTKRSAA
jgi:uncharacterized protein (DUF433 family)